VLFADTPDIPDRTPPRDPERASRRGAERERPILVVADHALTGALVESLVEVAGHHPITLQRGETPLHAIGRVNPGLVLLDIDHQSAEDDRVYDLAREAGSRLLLFASGGDRRALVRAGERRGVATCRLPVPHREFAAMLARALEG
jgi:DNA-binding NtrC family response regulator